MTKVVARKRTILNDWRDAVELVVQLLVDTRARNSSSVVSWRRALVMAGSPAPGVRAFP